MAKYRYRAITNEGKSLEGVYSAKNEEEVILMLRENRYYPINIKETEEEKDIRSLPAFGKVKAKDIAIFCRQFYTMRATTLQQLPIWNVPAKMPRPII